MFTALHPVLLWGAAAIAVPILIHLLLRQRPRPRPWAAMRWLLAAAQVAQRRYRLTNILLLLLRCLALLLVALAIARPSLVGMGSGERLIMVVDATASMGSRGNDPGPLAAVKAQCAATPPEVVSIALVVVTDHAVVVADGSRAVVMEALARVEVAEIPGGVDRCAEANESAVLAQLLESRADVIVISDFQQDDGARTVALCRDRCRSVSRWCVGQPGTNALLVGVNTSGDAVPGQSGELTVNLVGQVRGAAVAVDDGSFLSTALVSAGADVLRLVTPPLAEGTHRVRVRIEDDGLAYDNFLEVPVQVRPAVGVMMIQDTVDYVGAAVAADTKLLAGHVVRPAATATEAFPEHGVVALRVPIADSTRLAAWVRQGGVLWAPYRLLADDAQLREFIAGLSVTTDNDSNHDSGYDSGGEFISGFADIDDVLRIGRRDRVAHAVLPPQASVALRAGTAPLVVTMPVGRGAVIVELEDLARDAAFVARGTTPTWVARLMRRSTAQLHAPSTWQAGTMAPESTTLERRGRHVVINAGTPLLVPPGLWNSQSHALIQPIIVVPSREEARIDRAAPAGTMSTFDTALPRHSGRDASVWLAILALAVVIIEGLFAAWAGRRYGHG